MDNNQPEIVQQQSIPVPPPVPPPGIPPSGKQKKLLLIVGVIIVVLAIIAVSVVFFISKKTPVVVIPSPTPFPTTAISTPTTSPTSANPAIELVLTKGKVVSVPNSPLTIVYKGQSAPNPKCVDCSTTTNIVVTSQKVDQKLSYVCGGIAGTCTEKQSAYGYNVTLVKVDEAIATVKIQKQ